MHGTSEVIRLARELNPRVLIFARSTYLREQPALREAGADVVFSGEGEVALAMTEFLLRQLGATPEQIDRETGTHPVGVLRRIARGRVPPRRPGMAGRRGRNADATSRRWEEVSRRGRDRSPLAGSSLTAPGGWRPIDGVRLPCTQFGLWKCVEPLELRRRLGRVEVVGL